MVQSLIMKKINKERITVNVQKDVGAEMVHWKLSKPVTPKYRPNIFGSEKTNTVMCFSIMLNAFSGEGYFSHNSTIMS